MRGLWRIALVVILAAAAAVVSAAKLQARRPVVTSACGKTGLLDSSYKTTVRTAPDPPQAPSSTVVVTVTQAGQPVSGATACLSVDMVGMPMGMSKFVAREISPGQYDDVVTFGMAGTWEATLVVSIGGKPVASQSVNLQVK